MNFDLFKHIREAAGKSDKTFEPLTKKMSRSDAERYVLADMSEQGLTLDDLSEEDFEAEVKEYMDGVKLDQEADVDEAKKDDPTFKAKELTREEFFSKGRAKHFKEFVDAVKSDLIVDLTKELDKYILYGNKEISFCKAAQKVLAKRGYYVYNSDSRFEVYLPEDVEAWLEDGIQDEDERPNPITKEFEFEPTDLNSVVAMWFEDWDDEDEDDVDEAAKDPEKLFKAKIETEDDPDDGLPASNSFKDFHGKYVNQLSAEAIENLENLNLNSCDRCEKIQRSEELVWTEPYFEGEDDGIPTNMQDYTALCEECFGYLSGDPANESASEAKQRICRSCKSRYCDGYWVSRTNGEPVQDCEDYEKDPTYRVGRRKQKEDDSTFKAKVKEAEDKTFKPMSQEDQSIRLEKMSKEMAEKKKKLQIAWKNQPYRKEGDEFPTIEDVEGNVIEIGDAVVCMEQQGYCMGQDPSEGIADGETVTVEDIDLKNGGLSFDEHPTRYGPWSPESFMRFDEYVKENGFPVEQPMDVPEEDEDEEEEEDVEEATKDDKTFKAKEVQGSYKAFTIDSEKFEADKDYELGGIEFGVIEGASGWIFTNNEAIHYIGVPGQPINVNVYSKTEGGSSMFFRPEPAKITLEELREYKVSNKINWKKWIRYFGIKDRIGSNYGLLQKSAGEINANVDLPDFWAREEGMEEAAKAKKDDPIFKSKTESNVFSAINKLRKRMVISVVTKRKGLTAAGRLRAVVIDIDKRDPHSLAISYNDPSIMSSIDNHWIEEEDIEKIKVVPPNEAERAFIKWANKTGVFESVNESEDPEKTFTAKTVDEPRKDMEWGWWNYAYRHNLRDAGKYVRAMVKAALTDRNLDLGGKSPEHTWIILHITHPQELNRPQDELNNVWGDISPVIHESVNELAFQPGPRNVVHPQKKQWIETGDEKINALMPELSGEEQTYLEKIASKGYADLVQRIERYTGIQLGRSAIPSLFSLLIQSLEDAKEIEGAHTEELEALALNMVLAQEEFEMVQIAYNKGKVKFDIKLGRGELENLLNEDEPQKAEEGELTEDEETNLELANLWDQLNDAALRRKFANLMIQGGAFNKMYMFHMAEEELNHIEPRLIRLYGILASVAQIGYWATPFGIELAAAGGGDTAAGSEEVIPEDGIYTIKARGITFPYLVHEVVKGIYEWLAIDPDTEREMKKERLEHETTDIIAGPEVFKAVSSYLTTEQQNLFPLVQKLILQLKGEDLKEILAKSEKGQQLMQDIIRQAEEGFEGYKRGQI